MLRKLLCAMFVMAASVGLVLADESKGKVKKIEKGAITVTVGDKDTEFKMAKGAKVFEGDTEVTDKKDRAKLMKGLEGKEVTIVHDKDSTEIKELKVKK